MYPSNSIKSKAPLIDSEALLTILVFSVTKKGKSRPTKSKAVEFNLQFQRKTVPAAVTHISEASGLNSSTTYAGNNQKQILVSSAMNMADDFGANC